MVAAKEELEQLMDTNPEVIHILAADDHPFLREGIAMLIATQRDMLLVAEAANGREAIQQFRAHHPDVTLMDLQMPEMNGLEGKNQAPTGGVFMRREIQ